MAIIYNIFTKQVINIDTLIQSNEASNISSSKLNAYEYAKERVIARFGDDLPKHMARYYKGNKHVMVPYLFGCTHNLSYRTNKTSRTFNKPYPIPANLDYTLEYLGLGVRFGNECDPFAWIDTKYHITLSFLKAKANGSQLTIETRSDLIAHDDYLSELCRLKTDVTMYMGDADENELRRAEPGAPSNKRRQQAIDKLRQVGISVNVVYLDKLGNNRLKDVRDSVSA